MRRVTARKATLETGWPFSFLRYRRRHTMRLLKQRRSWWPFRKRHEDQAMPGYDEDQADAVATETKPAEDAANRDMDEGGDTEIEPSGMAHVRSEMGRTLGPSLAAETAHRLGIGNRVQGEFNTHDPKPEPLKVGEEDSDDSAQYEKLKARIMNEATLADQNRKAAIEQELFGGGAEDQPVARAVPDADYGPDSEYAERSRRESACIIAARLHQGRGLNMRDFLDECDVVAEYIKDGFVPDYGA